MTIHDFTPWSALLGGAMIGLSAALLMWLNGRIAGISGILGGLLTPRNEGFGWRAAFVLGLVGGGVAVAQIRPSWIELDVTRAPLTWVVAGVLVGFGARLGSGCTSGHGVCGLARLSERSLASVLTFIASGVLTVLAMRLLTGGVS